MHLSKGLVEKKSLHISSIDKKFVNMVELLSNVENFGILDQDPLKTLKSSSFRIADNWRKRGLLGKDTRWRDIDTTNIALARWYGLRKIHKENYPLRLVISTIKVKSHTKLDEKEFLKWLDFIMNSTKFKFKGKFYKQKFGTSIGSVISQMLAEIVMEDLEPW